MRTVTFTIPGEPKGKGRPRFSSRSGRTYTPSETHDYENKVRLSYSQQVGSTRLYGAIRADITAYSKIPKSTPKKKAAELAEEHTPCLKAPDADNIAKIVLDALDGLVYENDKAVIYLTVGKLYGAKPRVQVTLTEVNT